MMPSWGPIRWCKSIGMFAIDRSRKTCVHQTPFCKLYCYNIPLYRFRGQPMLNRDKANDEFWDGLDGKKLTEILARKKNQTKRLRLCTRGEAFATSVDVRRVRDLIWRNPDTLFWIPTRGWRHPKIRAEIEEWVLPISNARVLASVDPTNTQEEIEGLKLGGWSTVRIGTYPRAEKRFRCPKTYEHREGHCTVCMDGCFSRERVDVHLRLHWAGCEPKHKDWATASLFAGEA